MVLLNVNHHLENIMSWTSPSIVDMLKSLT